MKCPECGEMSDVVLNALCQIELEQNTSSETEVCITYNEKAWLGVTAHIHL